jgi:NAD(P)-dependent dehydrogenase (short-subunit alcohol dehydrogenase family)
MERNMLQFDFSGRTAFVTGAASGIGREVARLLGNAKAAVTCADLQVKGAQATADLIKASGGNAVALSLDVADSASVKVAMVEAQKSLGPVDCLVNCAGIIDMQPVENIDDATWQQMLAVHLSGTFYTCRAVIPGMMARRTGAIVNTGSVFGVRGSANAAHYATVKAGIAGFTKSLAREKGPYGIRVNAVLPGPTMTNFFSSGIGKVGDALKAAITERAKVIPMGSIATVEQVAPSYLYLLSDAASHITGECLLVDGGEIMA